MIQSRTTLSRRALVLAAAGYLLLSLALFSHFILSGLGNSTLCSCGDPAYSLWFIGFAAHALANFDPLLFTSLLWHPEGVNVLDGATQLGIGVPLAPITWVAGATTSLDVALLLAPVLSAFGIFMLLLRWVGRAPAAFVGGLLVGFSPFLVMNLAQAHFVVAWLVLPPLIVLCLDELLRTRRHPPVRVGLILGTLVAWQFFISTELLAMTAAACGIGLAALGLRALIRGWDRISARRSWTGLVVGAVTSLALLAYPTWFAITGPAHVSGVFYPSSDVATVGTNLRHLLLPAGPSAALSALSDRFGAYQGPVVPAEYLGIGALSVAVLGLFLRRRDPRAWLLFAVGGVFFALSFGGTGGLRPWSAFSRVPLLENIIPARLLVVTIVCIAGLVAFAVDGLVEIARRRDVGIGLSLAAAILALLPIAADLAPAVPLTASPVVVPTWFRSPTKDKVVLPIPVAFSGVQSAMAWQAEGGYRFAMAGGDGPGSDISKAAGQGQAELALLAVSGSLPPHELRRNSPMALRRALAVWNVDAVVLPVEPGLPAYDRALDPVGAAALITAATGRSPIRERGALVWRGRSRRFRGGYLRCTVPKAMTPFQAANCVMRGGR